MNVRSFNRAITNPIMRLIAGKFIYALVYHTGRRSGEGYTTPVVAAVTGDSIFIPLPYGTDTDWFLNVQTSGACKVKLNGKTHACSRPEVVSPASALPAFLPFFRIPFKMVKIEKFARLSVI
jgi:deazaflavin-dependent oxidoreductase (nitroreductase family)